MSVAKPTNGMPLKDTLWTNKGQLFLFFTQNKNDYFEACVKGKFWLLLLHKILLHLIFTNCSGRTLESVNFIYGNTFGKI